jgi:hypothetical protein
MTMRGILQTALLLATMCPALIVAANASDANADLNRAIQNLLSSPAGHLFEEQELRDMAHRKLLQMAPEGDAPEPVEDRKSKIRAKAAKIKKLLDSEKTKELLRKLPDSFFEGLDRRTNGRLMENVREAKRKRDAKAMVKQIEGDLLVATSYGELVDKIVILEKKLEVARPGSEKQQHVRRELDALLLKHTRRGTDATLDALERDLARTNRALWEIEDDIRALEKAQDFGAEFIRLARAVYFTNDERARLKRAINDHTGSLLTEVKMYEDYTNGGINRPEL